MNEESERLQAARVDDVPWRKWGPYLGERQWGTVREDYSSNGDAWNYLSHEASRSRAYRWGEDGIAGVCDDRQILCFAVALWNERDPILKERLFGLTNGEGNHGEDVKEYYFYLDNTATHSYMKYLYKYPQAAYPYTQLVAMNRQRSRGEFEYELLDTGVFADDRYFDVFVEYAKASPEDLLIEITVWNRGAEPAPLHVLPTLWFRNTWTDSDMPRPELRAGGAIEGVPVVAGQSSLLGSRYLYCQEGAELFFTENETNPFVFPSAPSNVRYYKDGIHYAVVHGNLDAVNPERVGTKCSPRYRAVIAGNESATFRLRLSNVGPGAIGRDVLGADFTRTFEARRREADEAYQNIIPSTLTPDQRLVVRQGLAGMLWSKQFYLYDVSRWLTQRGRDPLNPGEGDSTRNTQWQHMVNGDVISMPDKWEYPWYAAWDLAFHALPLSQVDPEFAKQQLLLLLQERYLHPNGQIPAYEWNFSDVNPPVHAWSAYFLYQLDRQRTGVADVDFLRSIYQKLLLNFTWWVNRKDPAGRNVFEGGFLGLDNIGVFDRSAPLPTGGYLEQADGTAWMAFYSQVMLQISLELAIDDKTYAEMALKFYEHFIWIASAMTHIGGEGEMWDEEDGFFYDVLRVPGQRPNRLKVRSLVGLLPLCASTVLSEEVLSGLPEIQHRASWFLQNRPQLVASIHDPRRVGFKGRRMLAIIGEDRLRRVLGHMLDEQEFLSPYGIRSLSAYHRDHPYSFNVNGQDFRVGYLPAESDTGMFGGNSNWRGPIWMPMNAILVRALLNYYAYYGDDFRVECPTGSGHLMNLYEVAREVTNRLSRIFTLDERGRRPVHGWAPKFTDDPLWRDNILFYEYFHGDNGAGIGASHQTGWTGLVASLLTYFGRTTPEQLLVPSRRSDAVVPGVRAPGHPGAPG